MALDSFNCEMIRDKICYHSEAETSSCGWLLFSKWAVPYCLKQWEIFSTLFKMATKNSDLPPSEGSIQHLGRIDIIAFNLLNLETIRDNIRCDFNTCGRRKIRNHWETTLSGSLLLVLPLDKITNVIPALNWRCLATFRILSESFAWCDVITPEGHLETWTLLRK